MSIKICCISDLHGYLPKIPTCELLIIAEDFTPWQNDSVEFQHRWLHNEFRNWLYEVPAKEIVYVAGNHDVIFERYPDLSKTLDYGFKVHYIENKIEPIWITDQNNDVHLIRVFGTPYQLPFSNVFVREEAELDRLFNMVAKGIDIIVSHGPPLGYGDLTVRNEHVGSVALLNLINRVRPTLVVTVHIHNGHGLYKIGPSTVLNAAIVDESYSPTWAPSLFEFEVKPRNSLS